eukprot:UN27984
MRCYDEDLMNRYEDIFSKITKKYSALQVDISKPLPEDRTYFLAQLVQATYFDNEALHAMLLLKIGAAKQKYLYYKLTYHTTSLQKNSISLRIARLTKDYDKMYDEIDKICVDVRGICQSHDVVEHYMEATYYTIFKEFSRRFCNLDFKEWFIMILEKTYYQVQRCTALASRCSICM